MTTSFQLRPGEVLVYQTHRGRAWYNFAGEIVLMAVLLLGAGFAYSFMPRGSDSGLYLSLWSWLVILVGISDMVSMLTSETVLTSQRILSKGSPNLWSRMDVPLDQVERVTRTLGGVRVKQKGRWLPRAFNVQDAARFVELYQDVLGAYGKLRAQGTPVVSGIAPMPALQFQPAAEAAAPAPGAAPPTVSQGKMTIRQVLFSFEGRIPRSTYWLCWLGFIGGTMVAAFLGSALSGLLPSDVQGYGSIPVLIAFAFVLYCWWTVNVKRCHDLNHSGLYLLWGLAPFLGQLILFVELGFIKGTDGPNRFGPDPLAPRGEIPAPAFQTAAAPVIPSPPAEAAPLFPVQPLPAPAAPVRVEAPLRPQPPDVAVDAQPKRSLLVPVLVSVLALGALAGLVLGGRALLAASPSTGQANRPVNTPNAAATYRARTVRSTRTAMASWENSFAAPILSTIARHTPNFEDDFSTRDGRALRWPSVSAGVAFEDGLLRLQGTEWHGAGGSLMAEDFVIQFDVTPRVAGEGGLYVVTYRNTPEHWYHFGCNLTDAWCGMMAFTAGTEGEVIGGNMTTISIMQRRTLLVMVNGDQMGAFINGKPFAYVRDARFHGDWVDIGLWSTPGESEVEFDNVKFWDLNNLQP